MLFFKLDKSESLRNESLIIEHYRGFAVLYYNGGECSEDGAVLFNKSIDNPDD